MRSTGWILGAAAALVGFVLSVGVAVHEIIYRVEHADRPGVSGVLIVLALAVAFGCLPLMGLAWRQGHEDSFLSEARRRRAAERRQWERVLTRDDELFLCDATKEETGGRASA